MAASDPPTPIGLLEARSIARGLVALDHSVKAADVELLWSRTIEPGRYLYLMTGAVDAVRAALAAGQAALGDALAGALFLANPHEAVLARVRAADPAAAADAPALGLLECRTIAATLLAADAAAKAAQVTLVRIKVDGGMGGKGLVILAGETADVESAVHAGAAVAESHAALDHAETIDGPARVAITGALDLG